MVLSARLEAVLALLAPCRVLADVGTDHALVPIAAVSRGLAERAIATDLRSAPLVLARANIERAGLAHRVALHRGDGLSGLLGQGIDAVVMAGISGGLVLRVFAQGRQVLDGVAQLVLQPNQEVEGVRAWALEHGFHVRAERMVEERGQFFATCAFHRAAGADPAYHRLPLEVSLVCRVGPLLLASRDATTLRWCELQRGRIDKLVQRGVPSLESELSSWQAACAYLRS